MSPPNILVVDDDPEIGRLLGKYLDGQGFRCTIAANRRSCEQKIADARIDLVVLDVMLPDGSGLDICRDLKDRRPEIAIILLTALKEDVDRIIGLEIGADDYLGKPFNPRELAARIRAVLRRGAAGRAARATGGADALRLRRLHRRSRAASATDPDGSEVSLTGAEFDLLMIFLERPGRVLSRDVLMDLLHGRTADPFDRSIDVTMSRLRRKFNDSGVFRLFKTVRNGGYQFAARVATKRRGLGRPNEIAALAAGDPPGRRHRRGGRDRRPDLRRQVLERPDRESFQRGFAEEVRIIAAVLASDPRAADRLGIDVGPAPNAERGFRCARRRHCRTSSRKGASTSPSASSAIRQSRTRQLALRVFAGPLGLSALSGLSAAQLAGLHLLLALIVVGAAAVSHLRRDQDDPAPCASSTRRSPPSGRDGLPAHVPEDGPAEVRATAAALNRLTARVRAAMESRMRLVAAAGHDLRTPMTRMRLRAEFLPEEERETWLKDLAELDRIADSAIRLVREEVDPTARWSRSRSAG